MRHWELQGQETIWVVEGGDPLLIKRLKAISITVSNKSGETNWELAMKLDDLLQPKLQDDSIPQT